MRLTKHRQEILDVLSRQHGALTVGEIHAALPHINLVTIYRNLELFVKNGLIKKFHLDSAEAVFEFQKQPHHHAICTDCDRVIHFTVNDQDLERLIPTADFTVDTVEIMVKGRCMPERKHYA